MICKYLVVLSWDEKVATLDNGITLLIEVVEKSRFIKIKLQVGVNTLCSVTGKLTFHKLMILCTNNMHSYCNSSELLALWEEFWNYKNSSSNHARACGYLSFLQRDEEKSLNMCSHDNEWTTSSYKVSWAQASLHTSTALKIINRVLPAFQDPDRRFRMEMIRRHKPWNKRREQIQLNEAQVYFKCSTFHSKNTITDWEHDTILSYTEKCEESLIACLSFWQKTKQTKKLLL